MFTNTIADKLVAKFLTNILKTKNPENLRDKLKIFKDIPEFSEATKINAGPRLFTGDKENSCGKIAVSEWTGGTSGAKEIYEKMAQAGVGTIIGMHMHEGHRTEAEKYHLNVVIAGHMACDSLGMNLFLDELEKKGIKVIPCSGLIRIKRKNK